MKPRLVDRKDYDHPEHFDDLIREYQASNRYFPTPLEDLLLEQCGHRCTVCSAPYCEIHHIEHLSEGGLTQYENLIVLCPNCHTRVHKENVPSKSQLRQYKLKLEVVYTLPTVSKLTIQEKAFIKTLSALESNLSILSYRQRFWEDIPASEHEVAKSILREKIGLFNLEFDDIIKTEYGLVIGRHGKEEVSVELFVRATSKAAKWITYLKQSNRLSLFD